MDILVVVIAFGLVVAAAFVVRWAVNGWDASDLQRKAASVGSILALAAIVVAVVNRPIERVWDSLLDGQPSVGGRSPGASSAPPSPSPTSGAGPIRLPTSPTPSRLPADGATTGDWHAANGPVTVRVTRVELRGGVLTLSLKAENRATEAATLSLYRNFIGTDGAGRTYEADLSASDWAERIPAGGFITGTVTLSKQTDAGTKTLTVSFTDIFIFRTIVNGGISIKNVPVPRS
jgi:hypothetical protein